MVPQGSARAHTHTHVHTLAHPGKCCSVFFLPDFKWKKAICDSETSRLDRIPSDLPSNLVELHVTHQFISVLGAEGLRELVHLQTLAIESSGLRRIMLDAFQSLTNLTQLNLRNNSLQLGYNGLPAEVIRSLPRLKMLNLAENPLDIVPDLFFTTPGSAIPTFAGLRYLRLLDLSYAKLTTLPVSLANQLDLMPELKELYLGGNPWHCDCQLRWLPRTGLVYLQQHVISEPICFSPEPLRDRKLFGSDPVGTIDFSEFHYGALIKNDSHFSVLNQFVEETLVSELYAQFSRVGESTAISCTLDGYPGEITATYHVTVVPYDASLDTDNQGGLTGNLELTGISVTHQSWIYAGVGAGILFILLTSIGVGIFYCCDPRSQADQTFQRIVGKDQVNRLRSCYGCQKLPGSATKQNGEESREKGLDASGVRTNDARSQNGEETAGIELCPHSVSRSNSPLNQALPKPIIVTSVKSEQSTTTNTTVPTLTTPRSSLAPLGGSLIRETVSTGENRLLVSCDGPEPTVLLATRFSAYNDLSSPSSVYGMFDASKLSPSIKVSLPGSVGSYICSPSFSGQPPTALSDKTHIYASLSPVTNLQGLHKTPQLISLPKARYTTPCPVHGSIQLDRVGLSQTQNPSIPGAHMINPVDTDQNYGSGGSSRLGLVPNSTTSSSSTVVLTSSTGLIAAGKPIADGANSMTELTGKPKLSALPEHWYRSTINRSKFNTDSLDHEEAEDNQDAEDEDEENDEDVDDVDVDGDEQDDDEEDEDDDDDSGLLPHSTNLNPLNKSDNLFRGAAQFSDPRRFKSRGGTTLHRPKSFTVLNSRLVSSKSRMIMPQSGSAHSMRPDPSRTGRCYIYPTSDTGILSSTGANTPPKRRGLGTHPRAVPRIPPRRPSTVRPLPSVGPPYKSCIRTSFSGDLDRVREPVTVHGPPGSNPETSDETWNSNSNSDSGTPTEETSSLTNAVEVMSNTERSTYAENEFAGFPRRLASVRRRGSSSTLNFPTHNIGWSNYPSAGGHHQFSNAPVTSGMRSTSGNVYRVATLPSRLRQSRSPGSGSNSVILSGQTMMMMHPAVPTSGSYRDFATIQRRSSTQRSQTLVRPGSKHKLDTDSGTDNNDC
ncbi:unnamed protein product [Echinostoma caproni]|uniref:LRRCT domain-containing protein n=1 Tax=Echinostoma caproni TaxID=27848 RepID=A0A3P8ENN1_9TREM|nr:unnamed protein product [Echinostoma caproni]